MAELTSQNADLCVTLYDAARVYAKYGVDITCVFEDGKELNNKRSLPPIVDAKSTDLYPTHHQHHSLHPHLHPSPTTTPQ